jgi:hypothetical protein
VSRNRNRFKQLDLLASALAKRLCVTDAILDGEIICADATGRPIFIEMLRGRHRCASSPSTCCPAVAQRRGSAPAAALRAQRAAAALLRWRANHIITEALAIEGPGQLSQSISKPEPIAAPRT